MRERIAIWISGLTVTMLVVLSWFFAVSKNPANRTGTMAGTEIRAERADEVRVEERAERPGHPAEVPAAAEVSAPVAVGDSARGSELLDPVPSEPC